MDKDPGSRIPRGGVDRGAELRVPRQPGGAGRGGPKLYAILIIAWRLCEQPDCSAHRCVNATSRTSPRPSDWAWSIAWMTWGAAFGKVCKAQGARCKVRQVWLHAALSLGGPPSPTPIFSRGAVVTSCSFSSRSSQRIYGSVETSLYSADHPFYTKFTERLSAPIPETISLTRVTEIP